MSEGNELKRLTSRRAALSLFAEESSLIERARGLPNFSKKVINNRWASPIKSVRQWSSLERGCATVPMRYAASLIWTCLRAQPETKQCPPALANVLRGCVVGEARLFQEKYWLGDLLRLSVLAPLFDIGHSCGGKKINDREDYIC